MFDILNQYGAELITYALCLYTISLHLIYSRCVTTTTTSILIFPVSWVEAMFGPDSDAFPAHVVLLEGEDGRDEKNNNNKSVADALMLSNKG